MQRSRRIYGICRAVVLDDWIARVNFVYQSVLKMMIWLLVFLFCNRPNISLAISSRDPFGREQFQMALPLEAGAIFGAVATVTNCRVNFVGKVLPVELASHSVLHATLAGVSRRFWLMRNEKEVLTKGIWNHRLYRTIKIRRADQDSMAAIRVTRARILTLASTLRQNACLAWPANSLVSVSGFVFISGLKLTIGQTAGNPAEMN